MVGQVGVSDYKTYAVIYFAYSLFEKEYKIMYGNNLEFKTIYLGKQRIDDFFNRLIKLKVLL